MLFGRHMGYRDIVACEAGIALDLERVDLHKTLHVTANGAEFVQINPAGYVPVLQLDDGSLLSEGAVIVQFLPISTRSPV
jgi:glutathione S-transferase